LETEILWQADPEIFRISEAFIGEGLAQEQKTCSPALLKEVMFLMDSF